MLGTQKGEGDTVKKREENVSNCNQIKHGLCLFVQYFEDIFYYLYRILFH